LSKSRKWLNKLIKFYPELIHDPKVVELINQYKKHR